MLLRKCTRRSALRLAVLVVMLAVPSLPGGTGAVPRQELSTEQKRDEVRRRQGEVTLEVDALEAEHAELQSALVALADNVASWEAELDEAERAAAAAEEDMAYAELEVAAAQRRIEELERATDELFVEAYINPPVNSMFAAVSSENMSDAAVKQVLFDLQSSSSADLLDQLDQAHEDLELERESAEELASEARAKRADAEETLEKLTTAYTQQEVFVQEAEQALELKLAEAAVLEARDHELSEQIAEEQAAIARQIEAARQAAAAAQAAEAAAAAKTAAAPAQPAGATGGGPASITPVPGGLATVSCPGGGSITVAGSLGHNLRQLVDAAAANGLMLCGWGWRDPQRQVELRRAHCGASSYAIWHMPASQCSPPTARPGTSMHERGLAVDFTCNGGSITSRGNPCFVWLRNNAASYGLYNLPSEPWHWSTNGR